MVVVAAARQPPRTAAKTRSSQLGTRSVVAGRSLKGRLFERIDVSVHFVSLEADSHALAPDSSFLASSVCRMRSSTIFIARSLSLRFGG